MIAPIACKRRVGILAFLFISLVSKSLLQNYIISKGLVITAINNHGIPGEIKAFKKL